MSPYAQRRYEEFIEARRLEELRWWDASYDEIQDVIDARRRHIAKQRKSNEKRWFCEVPGCTVLTVREHAPICVVHDKRMHQLVAYRDGAR